MSENADDKQQGATNEEELATRQVQIQSKRFYIDVKENKRGRFIKLAEVGVGGRKSRILMSMGCAVDFKKVLGEFSEYNSSLGASHGTTAAGTGGTSTNSATDGKTGGGGAAGAGAVAGGGGENDGLLKSETIVKDRKRYYLDLKENQRGRFLRVSMVMSRGPRAPRAQIAIPAQGLIEFRDHLTELLNQYGTGDNEQTESELKLPESKFLKADNKAFYFDCGSNARGVFLRISEVRPYQYRQSITVPEKYWDQFCKHMKEFLEKVESERGSSASETAAPATTTTTTKAAVIAAKGGDGDVKAAAAK